MQHNGFAEIKARMPGAISSRCNPPAGGQTSRGSGQCIMNLMSQEPWLIATSDEHAVLPIACAHNHHFWACEVPLTVEDAQQEEEHARTKGDALVLQRHVAVQSLLEDTDGEPDGLLRRTPLSESQKIDVPLFCPSVLEPLPQ